MKDKFTTHPVDKSVKVIDSVVESKQLVPVDFTELSKFISFFFDKETNSLVIDAKVNVILKSDDNIGIVSKKDIVVLTGNGIDEKSDGDFRLNPPTPTRKY